MVGRSLGRGVELLLLLVLLCSTSFTYARDLQNRDKASTPFWHDTVIYQVYPRSFMDLLPDGTGDLAGIASKADYFVQLGVGTVWLSPIFTSPMADFGYDISNFTDIDPIFGTMADFDHLLQEMHSRGIKVLMDLVPNHSSDEHEWFQKSILKEEPYTDYYIWADPKGFNASGAPIPPNNWLSVFRGSAWEWSETRQQFYYHQFLVKQPDLNYRDPILRQEMSDVLVFWLDKNVDGFRLDAIRHMFEVADIRQNEPVALDSGVTDPQQWEYLNHTLTVNQPETFDVMREWRLLLDQYEDKLMMAEVTYDGDIGILMQYYGNQTDPLADFPFNFLLINLLQNRTQVTGTNIKAAVDLWMDNLPEGKWPNWLVGNHDQGRVASRLGVELVDALNMVTMLLPGTTITYYGEEIGMENTFISYEDTQDPFGCNYGPDRYQEFSRDPARTPMQWDDTPSAGFTAFNSTWLPVNENYVTLNVKAQVPVESHVHVYQALVMLRKEPSLTGGALGYPKVTKDVFSFTRTLDGFPSYLVVINTSQQDQIVDLLTGSSTPLPATASVSVRSITDTSSTTTPGSQVSLSAIPMVAGEGLVLLY